MNKSIKTRTPKSTGGKSRNKPHRNSEQKLSAKPAHARTAPKNIKSTVQEGGKLAMMVTMLRNLKGTSIGDLCKATGWQAHSVRGAISGTIKKRMGIAVTSAKIDGIRLYRTTD